MRNGSTNRRNNVHLDDWFIGGFCCIIIYAMYRGNQHDITINGNTFTVDSNLEERVIRWLENNGYSDLWERPTHGANVGSSNYTPDLLLSVQIGTMTHTAIVEVKPDLDRFTDYVSRRMRAVARHYYSDLLLLYTSNDNAWRRVDTKTGALVLFGPPIPGKIPISKLHRARTKRARSVFNHSYETHRRQIATVLQRTCDIVATILQELLIDHPKRHRRK